VPCAQDFVAARPLLKYWPGIEESHRRIQLWRDVNPQIDAIMNDERVREQVLRLVFPYGPRQPSLSSNRAVRVKNQPLGLHSMV
jgi:hypothetical protein